MGAYRTRGDCSLSYVLLLFALLFHASLVAQQQRFQQYGSADGLTNLNVHALLQDRLGYLWVGTDNGLFRYDGARFVEYSHKHGLPTTEVHALGQAPLSSDLWVATSGGLARFDETHTQHAVSWPDLAFGDIRQIAFDTGGGMYLLRTSGVLRCVIHGEQRPDCQVVVSGEVHSLLVHGTTLIFSRDQRLWLKQGGEAEATLDTPGLPGEGWQALIEDSEGNLWTRSYTHLFERLAGQTSFTDRSRKLEHNVDPQLAVDSLGHTFVSTLSGAVAFDAQGQTVLSTGHEASDDAVGPVLVDREGSLWLGMAGGGLLRRIGQGEWLSWKRENGLLNNSVWAIQHTRDGRVWVGTSAGLTIFDPKGRVQRSYTAQSGLPSDRALAIKQASTGDVFLGSDPRGLSQFTPAGELLRVYAEDAGLHGRISAIAIDHQDRLWLAGNGGVFRSQPIAAPGAVLRFERLAVPNTTQEAVFRDIAVTEDGSLWIAGSQGLALFSQAGWHTYKAADGLASDDLDVIAERNNVLWVAYRDALGMSRFNVIEGRFTGQLITKGHGLSADVIYALGFDRSGALWACSDRGADVLENGTWRHFDSANGLIWDDTNSHALDTEAPDGVWIGTSEGMSRFSPGRKTPYKQVANTAITGIQSGDHEWLPGQVPVLPYAHREISIHFTSLSFVSPLGSFRYRLSGYSPGWVETQSHSVLFEALPAGRYVFEVETQGTDGLWETRATTFTFQVLPPWWQRWYWIAGSALAVVLALLAIWRLRVRALVKQKEQLLTIVNHQTNDLRESHTRLEAIAYQDQLTSLPNRRKFSEELRRKLGAGSHSILLLIDLDRFKAINDRYGHDAGDAVLVQTATRLRDAVQEEGLTARLGGDEFAILLDAATSDAERVKMVCTRVLEACSLPIHFGGFELRVGCSIGVAMSGTSTPTEATLYKAADLALYQVKRSGRDGFSLAQHTAHRAEDEASAETFGDVPGSFATSASHALELSEQST